MLPVGLSGILLVLDVLLGDLGESLRLKISLVLKAGNKLSRVIAVLLGIFVIGL